MNNQYDTLSQALKALEERGYTHDFKLRPDSIKSRELEKSYTPHSFYIDEFHRFEGDSNPDDMSIVFAISCTDGVKGVLIDAYGAYSDPLNAEMIQKMKIN